MPHLAVEGTDLPSHERSPGDDVRRLPANRHERVRVRARQQTLLEEVEAGEREGGGGPRVDAGGSAGRVRGSYGELDLEPLDRCPLAGCRAELRPGVAVHEKGECGVLPRAAREQLGFAASLLLGRRAEQLDAQPSLAREARQSDRCSDRRSCDQIVAARVADARQGIVFGADDHSDGAGSERRLDSGLDSVGSDVDCKPCVREQPRNFGGRLMLLPGQFWSRVDGMAERDEEVARLGQIVARCALHPFEITHQRHFSRWARASHRHDGREGMTGRG